MLGFGGWQSADGFVALPGGTGTLDELFETFTWLQLGIHSKPVGVLDVDDYWQPLVALIEHAVAAGFLRAEHAEALLVDDEPDGLLDAFASWIPPHHERW